MQTIRLFAGLGNPGDDYSNTRHNAGFWFVDELANKLNITWVLQKKFQGMIAEAISDGSSFFGNLKKGSKIFLFKPMQYMNRSGLCISSLAKFYDINPNNICVIHDELDLPVGDIRLKFKGGSGGHNGLKDIRSHLSSEEFYRLRVGISHPGHSHLVHNYVLKSPSISDRKILDKTIDRAIDEFGSLLSGDFAGVMQRLNTLKVGRKSGDKNNGI